MQSSLPVAVVGAGPYGLSLASHLSPLGVPYRIFGRPMDTWASHMPRGMFLKSEGMASNLWDPGEEYTLRRYCEDVRLPYRDNGWPVPVDDLVGYALWFQRELVPKVEEEQVEELDVATGPGGSRRELVLRLSGGETVRARNVVLATGAGSFAHVPASLRTLPDELVTHTWDLPDARRFAGSRVLVVGGGQSALESAALLAEAGATVQLVVRKPQVAWNPIPSLGPQSLPFRLRNPLSGLGLGWKLWFCSNLPSLFPSLPESRRLRAVRSILGPAGAWWLRERVEGTFPVLLACRIDSSGVTDDGVRLDVVGADGVLTHLEADHVVAATGYRVSVPKIAFWGPGVRTSLASSFGFPVLSRNFESSVPGLYLTGLAAALRFGPVMRFLFGARFTARHLASHLASPRRAAR